MRTKKQKLGTAPLSTPDARLHAPKQEQKNSTPDARLRKPKKIRLDDLLISRGAFNTRDDVKRAVIAGEVRLGNSLVKSAAEKVAPDAGVQVRTARKYVSRGGFKLEGALRDFAQDVHGLRCVDIGSSTGGFTDCLLQHGALSVACVDVNYGQLAWKLRENARVTVFERTNVRTANPAKIGAPFDLLVADLSFIGLSTLAQTLACYCSCGSVLIALVKPQFESRPGEAVGGYVESDEVRERCVQEVREALEDAGFSVTHTAQSSIRGKKRGNIEYLLRATY